MPSHKPPMLRAAALRRGAIAASLGICCAHHGIARAQEEPGNEMAAEDQEDEIVVSGRVPRGQVDTPLRPEVSIPGSAVRVLGAISVEQALEAFGPRTGVRAS